MGGDRAQSVSLARFYLLWFLPLNFVSMNLLAVDQGLLQMGRFNAMRLLQPLVFVIALLVLLATGNVSVLFVIYAALLSQAVVAVTRVAASLGDLLWTSSKEGAAEIVSTALSFHAVNLLFFVSSQIDSMFILSIGTNAQIGYYVVALNSASASLGIVMQTFQTVMFPSLAQRKESDAVRYLTQSLRYATFFLGIGTMGLLALMPFAIPILFGKAFSPSIMIAELLIIAFSPKALRGVMNYSLKGLGHARPQMVAEAIGIIVFLATSWSAYQSAQLLGIAAALGLANLASLAFLVVFVRRETGLSVGDWWGGRWSVALDLYGRVRGMISGISMEDR